MARQVGDGAREPQDAVIGPRRKVEPRHRAPEQGQRRLARLAVRFQFAAGEPRILLALARQLPLTRCEPIKGSATTILPGIQRPMRATSAETASFSAMIRLSRTLWSSKTVGRWNFRPTPARAILASFSDRSETEFVPHSTSPSSGRVLPVTMSMKVVLPAPLGPMIARNSCGPIWNDRLRMAR